MTKLFGLLIAAILAFSSSAFTLTRSSSSSRRNSLIFRKNAQGSTSPLSLLQMVADADDDADGGGGGMKVAYVFRNSMASTFQLASMILPQLEEGTHGVDVVGMFFFDDNGFCLRKGDPVGERLSKIAADRGMLLMMCDQCAVRRNLAEGTLEMCGSGDVKPRGMVDGATVGCFPQLYKALSGNMPDQVITL